MKHLWQSFTDLFAMMRVSWRHLRGRWYVFRDEPIEVVRMFAEQDLTQCVGKEHEEDLRALILEARAELRLRERRA